MRAILAVVVALCAVVLSGCQDTPTNATAPAARATGAVDTVQLQPMMEGTSSEDPPSEEHGGGEGGGPLVGGGG